ncbi:MAG: NAD-dependent epimerase/dehydratase family protein [Aquificales bacterium]|nr:NAD-dependent epimerase/dehydratase family protein [Aquificales bacterium]
MKLLILGGTRFVGRALVEEAQVKGHEVTLFNRGQSNPDLYPEIEQLTGDRDGNLDALKGRRWDAVIDTCGYVPRLVKDSAELLANVVDQYTFISSISVYSDFSMIGLNEDSPLGTMADETVEMIDGETYGPLKVLCEKAVDKGMNGRSLHIRAGLIVGPHDQTDRFSYWPYRVAQGGEVLAPGNPDGPVQFIDVHDLAAWTIFATEQKITGPYNLTGPAAPLSMQTLLETCKDTNGGDATFTWVDEDFILANDIAPWTELPLWGPGQDAIGMGTVACSKAQAQGLIYRPLADTVRDTLAWLNTRPTEYEWKNGLPADKEAKVLREWYKNNSST